MGLSNAKRAEECPRRADDAAILTLLDHLSEGVIVHDGIRVVHANTTAGDLCGGAPADLVGYPLDELFPDPYHEGQQLWPARSRVVYVASPEGEPRPLTAAEVPLVLGGEPVMIMLLRDPRVAAFSVETVAALDRMATAALLAAGFAHEVGNALVALHASLESMASALDAGRPGALAGDLELAREATAAITALVRDIQSYMRAGTVVPRPARAPRAAIERALRLARPRLRHVAQVGLRLGDVGPLRATESALTQIALNLLLNAAEALAEEEVDRNRIVVTLTREAEHVCLEVEDNGRGIAPDVLSRLFQPLVTGADGDQKAADRVSSGLGLAICRELVRSLGGHISVNVEPGVSTVFRVLLPAG